MKINYDKVSKILDDLHKRESIMNEDIINEIYNYLVDLYDVVTTRKMLFSDFDSDYVMTYDLESEYIIVYYQNLLAGLQIAYERCRDRNEVNEVDFINLSIVDSIIHELVHAKQKERTDNIDDNISTLLNNENIFLKKNNSSIKDKVKGLYHQKLYKEYHDYFMGEINANVNAALETYKINMNCNNVNLDDILFGRIGSIIMKSQKSDKVEKLHKDILKDYDLFKETCVKTKLKNKIYYGFDANVTNRNEITKRMIKE